MEADILGISPGVMWRYYCLGCEKKTNSTNWSTKCAQAESGRRYFTFWSSQQNIYIH